MRKRTTNATETNKHREKIPVWVQLAKDQFDPWQVGPRQVLAPHSRLLISTAFDVLSRVGCLGITGVNIMLYQGQKTYK